MILTHSQTALSDTDTFANPTFQVTNLKSAFHCFHTSKTSVHVQGSVQLLVRCRVFTLRICHPSPNLQPGGPHPFSAVRYCSFSTFAAIFHIHSLRRRHAVLTGTTFPAPSITMSRQYSFPFSCLSSDDILDPVTLRCCEDHSSADPVTLRCCEDHSSADPVTLRCCEDHSSAVLICVAYGTVRRRVLLWLLPIVSKRREL